SELWHDRYGRYYSLRADESVLSLVRTVVGRPATEGLAGGWCGQDLRLDIRRSSKGWTVGNGRGAPNRIQSIVTAGRYASLEGVANGTRFAYEFYRESGSLALIHVDASTSAPYVPPDTNGIISLARCEADIH